MVLKTLFKRRSRKWWGIAAGGSLAYVALMVAAEILVYQWTGDQWWEWPAFAVGGVAVAAQMRYMDRCLLWLDRRLGEGNAA